MDESTDEVFCYFNDLTEEGDDNIFRDELWVQDETFGTSKYFGYDNDFEAEKTELINSFPTTNSTTVCSASFSTPLGAINTSLMTSAIIVNSANNNCNNHHHQQPSTSCSAINYSNHTNNNNSCSSVSHNTINNNEKVMFFHLPTSSSSSNCSSSTIEGELIKQNCSSQLLSDFVEMPSEAPIFALLSNLSIPMDITRNDNHNHLTNNNGVPTNLLHNMNINGGCSIDDDTRCSSTFGSSHHNHHHTPVVPDLLLSSLSLKSPSCSDLDDELDQHQHQHHNFHELLQDDHDLLTMKEKNIFVLPTNQANNNNVIMGGSATSGGSNGHTHAHGQHRPRQSLKKEKEKEKTKEKLLDLSSSCRHAHKKIKLEQPTQSDIKQSQYDPFISNNILPSSSNNSSDDIHNNNLDTFCYPQSSFIENGDQDEEDGIEVFDVSKPKTLKLKNRSGLTPRCSAYNQKKRSQCLNPALMDANMQTFYCAEHIELDPTASVHKCDSKSLKFLQKNVKKLFKTSSSIVINISNTG